MACRLHCPRLLTCQVSWVFIASLFFIAGSRVSAEDWPQFLGPARNGISPEQGLIKAWPAEGLKEVWRSPAGVGMSSVVIQGGKALTTANLQGSQQLLCYDAKTGRPAWQAALAPAYGNGQGNGPRATPALDESHAYVYTGEGILAAVDLKNGGVTWKLDVVRATGAKTAEYGMSSSPLLVEDLVVVVAGGPRASVVAVDRKAGKIVWKTGNDPAGYASPAALTVDGKMQVVALTGASCLGIQPKTGKQLWRYPFATDFNCNTASAINVGANVFISAGETHGAALLAVDQGKVSEVWKDLGPRSAMKNEWQTSVLLDGKLYGLDNQGGAGPITHLACIDAKTGKLLWQQQRFGKSNMIAADGKLFFTTMKGEIVVVKANPAQYEELGRTKKVMGSTRQAPTLANGLLYVRDDRDVICFDVRK